MSSKKTRDYFRIGPASRLLNMTENELFKHCLNTNLRFDKIDGKIAFKKGYLIKFCKDYLDQDHIDLMEQMKSKMID